MKAIIPVAGYATRLYPITKNQPKALLKIKNKTMLEYCLDKIQELNIIEDVYIVTNNKFMFHFLERQKTYQGILNINIINDNTMNNNDRLGALGDLQFVLDQENINEDILVIAGDNFFHDNLLSLYNIFTLRQCSSISVYNLGDKKQASSFGVVEIDTNNKIITFEEKPTYPQSSLISTMVYFIKKEDLGAIKICVENGKQDNGGNLISELIKNTNVYAVELQGYRYDIGNKGQFNLVKEMFREGE